MGDILQPTHLLFVLVVALLVLGPKRLPEVGRALGRGLRDFRSAMSGEDRSDAAISPASDPAPASTALHDPATPSFGSETPTATDQPGPSPASEAPTATESEGPSFPPDSPPATENGSAAQHDTEPSPAAGEPVTSVASSDSSS